MLKLDIDNYVWLPKTYLLKLFFSIPLPFQVRKSSSGEGLHIKAMAKKKIAVYQFIRSHIRSGKKIEGYFRKVCIATDEFILKDNDYRRLVFDDEMRVWLDDARAYHNMPINNLVWDCKNGRRAGRWLWLRSQKDILDFFNSFGKVI